MFTFTSYVLGTLKMTILIQAFQKNICIIASMQNMQLERKNYFYPLNMTYFVNSKHFPNMIGQKWHTPLSMRIWCGSKWQLPFLVFFQYIFPIYQHWNIGLKNSGSLGP